MRVRVIDFETTGFVGGIVEVGWTDIVLFDDDYGHYSMDGPHSRLTNPGVPIGVEAMAVHHITEEMVRYADNAAPAVERYLGHDEVGVYVAHNADFDSSFWPGKEGVPWICTYKVALRAFPEAPRHSNQVLRYWLGLELDSEWAEPSHRAGPDTYVTAHLFLRLLEKVGNIEQMIEWTKEPAHLTYMPTGKYAGRRLDEVPDGYLSWVVDKSTLGEVLKFNCKREMERRRGKEK